MKPDETKRRSIVVCGKGGGGSSTVTWDDIQDKPDFAEVATSGDYEDLSNTPSLATVATSGSYNDLSNTPSLATVATTGDYEDLSNTPTIPVMPPMATETITFLMEGGVTRTVDFYVVPNYFYVQDTSGSDNTLSISKLRANAPDVEVFYSTDRANWTSMGTTSMTATTATIPANGKLYLKATANAWATTNLDVNQIKASGNHNVGGNIMSLIYGDNFSDETALENYALCGLFVYNQKLVNAEKLELPATALPNYAYAGMFDGCTALTAAPALPATTLNNCSYYEMFQNCTSLATAPALPATVLPSAVYASEGVYANMFKGCTALTAAPALPATQLGLYCYQHMFDGCTALTAAPELPATTLAGGCYNYMFQNCTSLTTAPELPAATLTYECYYRMFIGCTNLNSVTTYATNISANNCIYGWLGNVAATGDFYNLGGITYPEGASGIPTGWTEHTSL